MSKNVYVVLANGQVFRGEAFGEVKEVVGEIVFTTGMTGYLETLTDPSYYGQIVVQTFPLIGNYGVISSDFESYSPKLKAYIVREWCQVPSNFRSEGELDTFLKRHNIAGVSGIDTRELTSIIREYGVMNAKITANLDNMESIMKELKSYRIVNPVESVSSKDIVYYNTSKTDRRIVLWDFGAKENIRKELEKRNCQVINVPCFTKADTILNLKPDGIVLSNGPGDPEDNKEIIKELQVLCDSDIPMFGICLGHQLLAIAQGAKTTKLKYGHRGANHPVKDLQTGRVYITSQNHGYTVDIDNLPSDVCLSFYNVNDNTCEGINYRNMPAFSVQFHPEASAGPLDTCFLFDRFLDIVRREKNAKES